MRYNLFSLLLLVASAPLSKAVLQKGFDYNKILESKYDRRCFFSHLGCVFIKPKKYEQPEASNTRSQLPLLLKRLYKKDRDEFLVVLRKIKHLRGVQNMLRLHNMMRLG